MTMLTIIAYTIAVALASAFCLSLVRKWGWLEWLQVHANGFFYKLLSCHFCTSFWTGAMLSAIAATITGNVWILLCAPLSIPLTIRLW